MAISTLIKASPLFFSTSVLATHVPYVDFIELSPKSADTVSQETQTNPLATDHLTQQIHADFFSLPQNISTKDSPAHTASIDHQPTISQQSVDDLQYLVQNSLSLNDMDTMVSILPIYENQVNHDDKLLIQAKQFIKENQPPKPTHQDVIVVHSRRTFYPANSTKPHILDEPNHHQATQLETLLANSLALEDVETIQSILPNYKQLSLANQDLVNRVEDFLVQQKFLQPPQQPYQALHDMESFLANSIALNDNIAIQSVLADYEANINNDKQLIIQAKKIIQPSQNQPLSAQTNSKNQPNSTQTTDTQLQESLDALAMWVDTGNITQVVPSLDNPPNYTQELEHQRIPALVASNTKHYFQTICQANEYVHPVPLGVPYHHDFITQKTSPTSSMFITHLSKNQDYQGIGYLLSLVNLSSLKYTSNSARRSILSWYQDDPHIFGQTSALIKHLLPSNQT